jgi:hypothetical protein
MATDSQIDDAIVAFLTKAGYERKVAMVVVTVADTLSRDLPVGRPGLDLVAKRIEALVDSGRLDGMGDVTDWGRSEVRL